MNGDYHKLAPEFIAELEALEDMAGFPLVVNSGKRDPEHNLEVGGVHDSAHTEDPCRAADLAVVNSAQRYDLVRLAIKLGFTRIGIGKTFVHLDRSGTLPQMVMWHYYGA